MCYFGLSTQQSIDAIHKHPVTFLVAPVGIVLTETWEWLIPDYTQSTLYNIHTAALGLLHLYSSYKTHQLQNTTFSEYTANILHSVTLNRLFYSLYYVYKTTLPFASASNQPN